ncbi:hypothetical protein N8I74_15150 [Chitiniphilus purpureus]|uniref:Glycine zipper domain-containing protein n=1 Tax=Chitiniphilus purpureus TaxID=2981137 RepID=A0ABY6DJW2_9NEIS|nr:hypothetical protein [Chitiniphilus sp. CD1]UXY14647.1 hypothetical protein N8I74_15150 [Chitiniphilus sp. CD1]
MAHSQIRQGDSANPDPITKAHGSHPIGTALGAATGATAGIGGMLAAGAAGAALGPLGALTGAAIGAIAGGLIGKEAAEAFNPTIEDEYWREHHAEQSYASSERPYDEYAPAYLLGSAARSLDDGRTFDEWEPELRERLHNANEAHLRWENGGRNAAYAAWERVNARFKPKDIVG